MAGLKFGRVVPDGHPIFEGVTPADSWLWDALDSDLGSMVTRDGDVLAISTLEGVMTASPGDWIIRGVAGELYPCRPEIFEATYEAAD